MKYEWTESPPTLFLREGMGIPTSRFVGRVGDPSYRRAVRMLVALSLIFAYLVLTTPGMPISAASNQEDYFGAPRSFPINFKTTIRPIVGDFNSDLRPDVLLISFNSPDPILPMQLYFVRNLGNGTLDGGTALNETFPWTFCSGLMSADLNHDGNPDLLISGYSYPNNSNRFALSTLLGDGHGGFGNQRDYIIQSNYKNTQPPAIGDFNGDGFVDVVFLLNEGFNDSVIVMKGLSDGSFDFANRYTVYTGRPLNRIRTGDFNGDGKVDLLIADGSESFNGYRVLYGSGDGNFQSDVHPVFQNAVIPIGDINGDGIDDLFSSLTFGFRVYLGQSDKTFLALARVTFYGFMNDPIPGDFDHDGKMDLASEGTILFGRGDGTFEQYDYGAPLGLFAAVDMNQDGITDLVGGRLSVLLGRVDWKMAGQDTIDGPGNTEIEIGDVNGDGLLDILVVQSGIFLNQGHGKWSGPFHVPYQALELKDLDGDGRAELIGSQSWVDWYPPRPYSPQSVLIWPGDGTTNYSVPPRQYATHGYPSDGLRVLDLDKDGHLDIVGNGFVLYGRGGLDFDLVDSPNSNGVNIPFAHAIAVGDFNGDHVLDIFNMTGRFVLWGGPGRTFVKVAADWFPPPRVYDKCGAADVDHDGKDEILCPSYVNSPQLVVFHFLNTSNAQIVERLDTVLDFTTGDFDNDGIQEFVVGTLVESISFYRGALGDSVHSDYAALPSPSSPRSADIDNDGKLDLVYVSPGNPAIPIQIQVMYGSGGTASLQGPVLMTSTTTYEFGQTLTRSRTTDRVAVTNPGTVDVHLYKMSIAGPFEYSSDCPGTLMPGQSCDVDIGYFPVDVGNHVSQLVIMSDTKNESHVVQLKGEAEDFTIQSGPTGTIIRQGQRMITTPILLSSSTSHPLFVTLSCATDSSDWQCAVSRRAVNLLGEAKVEIQLTNRRSLRLSNEKSRPFRVRVTGTFGAGKREVVMMIP